MAHLILIGLESHAIYPTRTRAPPVFSTALNTLPIPQRRELTAKARKLDGSISASRRDGGPRLFDRISARKRSRMAENHPRTVMRRVDTRSRKRHVGFSGHLKNFCHSETDPVVVIPCAPSALVWRVSSRHANGCMRSMLAQQWRVE